jgi:hypothetical protein
VQEVDQRLDGHIERAAGSFEHRGRTFEQGHELGRCAREPALRVEHADGGGGIESVEEPDQAVHFLVRASGRVLEQVPGVVDGRH